MADLSHIGEIPDKAYVGTGTGETNVKSMQSMTETSVKATMRAPIDDAYGQTRISFFGIIDMLGQIIGGTLMTIPNAFAQFNQGVMDFIGGIADAIAGTLAPSSKFSPVQDAFQDAQAGLTNRLDLLEGVEAYAQSYMSKNRNGEWGSSNWRDLPFDAPLGPAKGAHVDEERGVIVLDSTGLWTVYARATGRATSFGGDGGVRMELTVYHPDGSVYSQQMIEGTSLRDSDAIITVRGAITLQATFPVVIDTPGCYIGIRAWSAAWRWWNGGTRWSSLSVLKHSSDIINPGDAEVPDEDQPVP
ncbi:hypothetical protein AALI21_02710 [Corynebacteriaceae bacterium 6-324]